MSKEIVSSISAFPLEGVRALEISEIWAGPFCGSLLADMGAEIIKVESPNGPSTRGNLGQGGLPEGIEGPPTLNTAGGFNDGSANKLSITLNTRTPRGIDLIKRLVSISDIVIENFAYGVLEKWGFGYSQLKAIKPDIVYVSNCGFGHVGPYASFLVLGRGTFAIAGHGNGNALFAVLFQFVA